MSDSENRAIALTEVAYRRIREAITGAEIQPGTFIRESQLSTELDMSRAAIREALVRLETENYVERSPTPSGLYGRWRVKLLTRGDMIDLYTCRGALQGLAAALAAERASTEQLTEMKSTLEKLRTATNNEDTEAMVSAATRFHGLVIEAASNERLKALLSTLRVRILENRRLMIEHGTRSASFVAQNDQLLQSIIDGDTEACERIARQSSEDDTQAVIALFDAGILSDQVGSLL